jgi:4'-phosphopantetheinyl transferase
MRGLGETLDDRERARAAAFRFEIDRTRYVAAHGALRRLLGVYTGSSPANVRLVEATFGKPYLQPGTDGGLRFNMSHSADDALIVIASEMEVGVDIERVAMLDDLPDVAAMSFSAAECDELRAGPRERELQRFYALWTRKEAYIKATGLGFSAPLQRISIPLMDAHQASPSTVRDESRTDGTWGVLSIELPDPKLAAAVAGEGCDWRVQCFQFDWGATAPAATLRFGSPSST